MSLEAQKQPPEPIQESDKEVIVEGYPGLDLEHFFTSMTYGGYKPQHQSQDGSIVVLSPAQKALSEMSATDVWKRVRLLFSRHGIQRYLLFNIREKPAAYIVRIGFASDALYDDIISMIESENSARTATRA